MVAMIRSVRMLVVSLMLVVLDLVFMLIVCGGYVGLATNTGGLFCMMRVMLCGRTIVPGF